jgi:hypothetical protein
MGRPHAAAVCVRLPFRLCWTIRCANRGVASTEAEREALGRTERLPNRVRTPLVLTYGGTADMPTSKA